MQKCTQCGYEFKVKVEKCLACDCKTFIEVETEEVN